MKGKLENSEGAAGGEYKLADIDASLDRLQKKLREGSALEVGERGSNKVAALAEELFPIKDGSGEDVKLERKSSKVSLTSVGGSENCHFCSKRVYVVERMSAEGKFFHRSCFRCDYCNILLRMGSYVFHKEYPFEGM